ncbi:MAG: OsmC family protein [Herpetosiphon sp.]|nr:OsmC family protein [Herpetosiphon sp.]
MAVRSAEATWTGSLREGTGEFSTESGTVGGAYSFPSRFESGKGSNPEELVAAAHAACFSMALTADLGRGNYAPNSVHTTAKVHIERGDAGFGITKIELHTEANVPDIDDATFQEYAEKAKKNCPISKALAAVPEITLHAKLVS